MEKRERETGILWRKTDVKDDRIRHGTRRRVDEGKRKGRVNNSTEKSRRVEVRASIAVVAYLLAPWGMNKWSGHTQDKHLTAAAHLPTPRVIHRCGDHAQKGPAEESNRDSPLADRNLTVVHHQLILANVLHCQSRCHPCCLLSGPEGHIHRIGVLKRNAWTRSRSVLKRNAWTRHRRLTGVLAMRRVKCKRYDTSSPEKAADRVRCNADVTRHDRTARDPGYLRFRSVLAICLPSPLRSLHLLPRLLLLGLFRPHRGHRRHA